MPKPPAPSTCSDRYSCSIDCSGNALRKSEAGTSGHEEVVNREALRNQSLAEHVVDRDFKVAPISFQPEGAGIRVPRTEVLALLQQPQHFITQCRREAPF